MTNHLVYTAHTNNGMQAIAKALADDCGGQCVQDRGVSAYGCPSMTVRNADGVVIATIQSGQNVSHDRGQLSLAPCVGN